MTTDDVTPGLIFVGDSQTAANGIQPRIVNCLTGAGCTNAAANTAYTVTTFANGGIGVTNMGQFDSPIAALYRGEKQQTIVLWGGTNDLLSFGQTAAQTYSAIQARVSAYRAMGYRRIVVLTMISLGAAQETPRQDLNTMIRNGAGSSTYGVADIGADPNIGDLADRDDTNFYNVDKLHLVAGGWNVVSPIVTTAIQALP